jgi:ketosteroid isomerase-like protein
MYEEPWNDDIEDVEPVIEAESMFLGALETLNVGKILECWSESDQVSMIFPGIEVARGPESIKQAWGRITENTSSLKLILRPISFMRLGDLGWTFLGGTIMSTHGDETLSVEVYVTNIYRREAGGWKIVHHHSTPSPHQPSYLEQRLN